MPAVGEELQGVQSCPDVCLSVCPAGWEVRESCRGSRGAGMVTAGTAVSQGCDQTLLTYFALEVQEHSRNCAKAWRLVGRGEEGFSSGFFLVGWWEWE